MMAQLPDGVAMAEKLLDEMKERLLSRPLTMPTEFYFTPIPTRRRSWVQATWEQVTDRALVEGSAPVFIGWDLGVEHKPARLPTADDRAVHRAIRFGHGDEKRMGAAQYVSLKAEGSENNDG